MKYEYTHKANNRRLILIFAGWSTDAGFYRHISLPGWDILVAYDYDNFEFPLYILDQYYTIALFAWSLGVYAAARSIPFSRLSLAVAINGTESPADDNEGIPAGIFEATRLNLDRRNLMKFRRRMCGTRYAEAEPRFSDKDPDRLAAQLLYISTQCGRESHNAESPTVWHRVYISADDCIFPPEAQRRAWETHPSRPEIVTLSEPHYIDFEKVITSALPAKEKVGRQFLKAIDTYDNQAIAQRAIASRLTVFPGGVPLSPLKVLEIGPGSGVFTKMFVERFKPHTMDFVELYPLPPFRLVPEEHYFTDDAEDWVAARATESPCSYDAVVSASALQWFANPETFFRNAARLLRPGGALICSTFLPGNLKELMSVSPYGLIYRSIDELETMIRKYFMFSKLEEEELIVDFDTPRDTLRHLKETGVGGGIATGHSPRRLLSSAPLRLTYRPLYIYAVKQL